MDSNAHVIQRRTRRRLLSPSEKYEVFVAVLIDLPAVFEDGVGAASSGIDVGYDECDLSMKWLDPSARLRQYSNVPKVVSLHSNKDSGFPWALKRSKPRCLSLTTRRNSHPLARAPRRRWRFPTPTT